ncbi:uncharacterized protein LOC123564690 [Mercenaria mercenaria]|uniref:uncharacterized protein LOC123564690 n=1 Tax=Mercenaria mercenaria TaxID=6596 RepID=UPI00234EB6A4|nr:uncharacterized protein LOC123564690 [Mercenaria mercenaria]
MFADDMVLFTTDQKSLQAQLDSLYIYSVKWGLKINIDKTKICIFRKRKQNIDFQWYINDAPVETVNSFCYLGMKFNCNGALSEAIKALSDQALKAVNGLYSLFSRLKFDVKTKLTLFDRMVEPILLYCAEVWGVYDTSCLDRIHMKFCKRILGVKMQTPNMAVLGELGRYPLSILCKERVLKYWLKLVNNPDSIMTDIFRDQCNNVNSPRCTNWPKYVKTLLEQLGYGYLWNHIAPNINYFPMLQKRLRDQFIQEWHGSITNMPKLEYYSRFKTLFMFEPYLTNVDNDYLRKLLSCFRMSSHCLAIETGRYSGIARDQRICQNCNLNVIESEYHVLLTCPKYKNLRSKYLPKTSWPNLKMFDNGIYVNI